MLNTNPFGFNTPQELNSLPSTELNWQNKFTGQIADLFKNSLNQSGKLSSYLGKSFEKNNLTGIGESVGKMLQGNFKGGIKSAVEGLGINKGITAEMSGFAKGMTGVGNVAGLANSALDVLGIGKIDRRTQSTGSKGLETFNKYSGVLMGTPLAPLAAVGAVAGIYDKAFAKSADKQGTADMSNIGYDTVINPLAGAKVGGWDRIRGERGKINAATTRANRGNSLAYLSGYEHMQNMQASSNTTSSLADKNYQQMIGGYGTNMISAKLGTKIPPVNLRKIANKAYHNFEQKYKFRGPVGTETFEEYRKRIGKLNPSFLKDDPYYNLRGAFEGGLEPELNAEDGMYHLGSRNPKTGEILKRPGHPTWDLMLKGEEEAGYEVYQEGDKWFSRERKKHKDGGLLTKADKKEVVEEVVEEKMNVIPEGAFHSRLNKYDETIAEHVTRKGIPVITKDEEGKVTQHAEVERNEIIFHKEATDTIESLHEKYKKADTQKLKDEIMIECGKYVAEQILVNTDDRTGIIETIE